MLSGVIVPLITPVDATGTIDASSLERLIESLRGRVSGLVPTLSTGEGWALSEELWAAAVAATVKYSGGLPVLPGIQVPDTAAMLARARTAADLGATGIVVPPPTAETRRAQVLEHYRRVTDATELGVMVYHEAEVSQAGLEFPILLEVCRLPGIVGVKESSGMVEFTNRLAAEAPVPVFAGWEHLMTDTTGVAGFIGPLANLEPELCAEALASHDESVHGRVMDACGKYGLLADDWYRNVKTELVRRGTITSASTVEEISR